MSDMPNEREKASEKAFRELRNRPTPELDSQGLWRKIEAGLALRSMPLWRRLFAGGGLIRGTPGGPARTSLRWAYGLAGIVVVVGVVWVAATLLQTEGQTEEGAELVVLNPAGGPDTARPQAADPPPAGAPDVVPQPLQRSVRLDLRLIRGYDGLPPDDVEAAAALGVGGADALADVRSEIDALLPHEEFGMLGEWAGSLEVGQPLRAELSGDYRLVASSSRVASGGVEMVSLENVELSGTGQQLVATDLNLEPGRIYILGVQPDGGGVPSLILVVRAQLEDPQDGSR